MQQSYDVLFASSNRNKFREAKLIVSYFGINLGFYKSNLQEIQSSSLRTIAEQKVVDAFNQCKKPVIVEDDGLFIYSLNGFPGPYSSYSFDTLGNKGILQLLKSKRQAKFQSIIGYCDKKNKPILFEATVQGMISQKPDGRGWGFDPIFIPNGRKETYAKINDKNKISHRYKALKKFSNWFVNRQESAYR